MIRLAHALTVFALALPFEQEATVGMPVWFRDLVLPGTELEVAPVVLETPVIVRIADVRPHGTAFRYDLVVYGLEAGAFDLRDHLVRRDGSTTDDLQPLPFEVASVLPAGQVEPHRPELNELPSVGGYTTLLWVGGVLWLVGLWFILRMGRKPAAVQAAVAARPLTVADRLRPLVEKAVAGTLSRAERSQLELTLIAFWRKKLDLDGSTTTEALAALRDDERAGPLLRSVEDWLHRPEPPRGVDVAELLTPYRRELADAEA